MSDERSVKSDPENAAPPQLVEMHESHNLVDDASERATLIERAATALRTSRLSWGTHADRWADREWQREFWTEAATVALVAANALPPTKCPDCGHQHTLDGCTGDPTPSDLWAGVSVEGCDCDYDIESLANGAPVTCEPCQRGDHARCPIFTCHCLHGAEEKR